MVLTPTAAERARTVLSHAATAQVLRAGSPSPVEQPMSEVSLLPHPARSDPGAGARCELEVADPAPVVVRERIRCRVRVLGWDLGPDLGRDPGRDLAPDLGRGPGSGLRLSVDGIELLGDGPTVRLTLDQVLEAAPDPVAACEASVLSHLASAHQDILRELLRLVAPSDLHGAVCVQPVLLDRRGIVLRIEHARGHRDHRLDFETPVSSPQELTTAMTVLIVRARTVARRPCPRAVPWASSTTSASPVEAVLRAAAAARRLCGP